MNEKERIDNIEKRLELLENTVLELDNDRTMDGYGVRNWSVIGKFKERLSELRKLR